MARSLLAQALPARATAVRPGPRPPAGRRRRPPPRRGGACGRARRSSAEPSHERAGSVRWARTSASPISASTSAAEPTSRAPAAEERVRPGRERLARVARHRQHRPPLGAGPAGGDERPALLAGPDHHHHLGHPGDDPVPGREVGRRPGVPSGCSETSAPPASRIRREQLPVLRRVADVDPGAEHGHGVAARLQRPAVGRARRCRARRRRRPRPPPGPGRAAMERASASPYSSSLARPDQRGPKRPSPRSSPRTRSAAGRSGICASSRGYGPSPGRRVRGASMEGGHIPAGSHIVKAGTPGPCTRRARATTYPRRVPPACVAAKTRSGGGGRRARRKRPTATCEAAASPPGRPAPARSGCG